MCDLEPAEGIEPTTYRLQGDCSTVELRRRRALFYVARSAQASMTCSTRLEASLCA